MARSALFVIFSLFCIYSPTNAWALSDEDYAYFLKSSPMFANAERQLNEVWGELRVKLPKEEYSRLLTEQRLWLRRNRDQEAARLKGNLSDADAYAAVTMARADTLAKRYNLQQSQTMGNMLDDKPDVNRQLGDNQEAMARQEQLRQAEQQRQRQEATTRQEQLRQAEQQRQQQEATARQEQLRQAEQQRQRQEALRREQIRQRALFTYLGAAGGSILLIMLGSQYVRRRRTA
jgi:hypothetical protein